MAKLENYNGSIQLIAGITQKGKGDFALIEANAVQTQEDGTRLDAELQSIKDSIVQSDWDETDSSKPGFIKNKPAYLSSQSADNVYFNENFKFTHSIGEIDVPQNKGYTEVEADGKNVKEFLSSIFTKEKCPALPQIQVSLSSSNIGEYEVGSEVEIQYEFVKNVEDYEWGPEIGITWSNYQVNLGGKTSNTEIGSIGPFTITEDTNLNLIGQVLQSAGNIPKTNLGNDCPSSQILETSWENLDGGVLTGYRSWFCGYKDEESALIIDSINSNSIRNLGNNCNGFWPSTLNTNKMKQIIFAAPKGTGKKPIVLNSKSGTPQTVKGPLEINVQGANNYDPIPYDIWYIDNAIAASGKNSFDILMEEDV